MPFSGIFVRSVVSVFPDRDSGDWYRTWHFSTRILWLRHARALGVQLQGRAKLVLKESPVRLGGALGAAWDDNVARQGRLVEDRETASCVIPGRAFDLRFVLLRRSLEKGFRPHEEGPERRSSKDECCSFFFEIFFSK